VAIEEQLDEWEKNPKFRALPEAEKANIYSNFFDREIGVGKYNELAEEERFRIKANFLKSRGVGQPVVEESAVPGSAVEPVAAARTMPTPDFGANIAAGMPPGMATIEAEPRLARDNVPRSRDGGQPVVEKVQYVNEDRGFVGDVVSRGARGVVHAVKGVGGAMRMLDLDPDKDEGAIGRAGKAITDWAGESAKKYDILKPDLGEARKHEGLVKRGFLGMVESVPASLVPAGGAVAGAVIGGAIGSLASPAGTFLGAKIGGWIGGTGTLFGTFGLGTYQNTLDETKATMREKGVPEVQIERDAPSHAFVSATVEAGSEFASDIAALTFFGAFGKKAVKLGVAQTIRHLMSAGGVKEFSAALAKNVPFEVGSEVGAAYFQTESARKYGLTDVSTGEAMKEAVLPAVFMSLLFGGGIRGMQAVQAHNLYKNLNSQDVAERMDAARRVYARLDDSASRRLWADTASMYIGAGKEIPLSEPIIDFATQQARENYRQSSENDPMPTGAGAVTDIGKDAQEAHGRARKSGEQGLPFDGAPNLAGKAEVGVGNAEVGTGNAEVGVGRDVDAALRTVVQRRVVEIGNRDDVFDAYPGDTPVEVYARTIGAALPARPAGQKPLVGKAKGGAKKPTVEEAFGQDAPSVLPGAVEGGSVSGGVGVDVVSGGTPGVVEDAPGRVGKAVEIVMPRSNERVGAQYVLEETGGVVASNTADGRPNPVYPEVLQPRDRERKVLRLWAEQEHKKLVSERLGENVGPESGAPVAKRGADGKLYILSGNGRWLLIDKAYASGRGENYRQGLRDNAEKFGYSAEEVDLMERPLLLRELTTPVDDVVFTREANKPTLAVMSPLEQARVDADVITDDDLVLFKPGSDGDIAAPRNAEFAQNVVGKFGTIEGNELLSKDGLLNVRGQQRLQAAMFAKAYQDDGLLEVQSEATGSDAQNLVRALNIAAGEFAQARGREGYEQVDVVPDVVAAAKIVMKSRRDGVPVEQMLRQKDLFEPDKSPEVEYLARFFDGSIKSPRRMGEALKAMAVNARTALADQKQLDMFGGQKALPGRLQIMERGVGIGEGTEIGGDVGGDVGGKDAGFGGDAKVAGGDGELGTGNSERGTRNGELGTKGAESGDGRGAVGTDTAAGVPGGEGGKRDRGGRAVAASAGGGGVGKAEGGGRKAEGEKKSETNPVASPVIDAVAEAESGKASGKKSPKAKAAALKGVEVVETGEGKATVSVEGGNAVEVEVSGGQGVGDAVEVDVSYREKQTSVQKAAGVPGKKAKASVAIDRSDPDNKTIRFSSWETIRKAKILRGEDFEALVRGIASSQGRSMLDVTDKDIGYFVEESLRDRATKHGLPVDRVLEKIGAWVDVSGDLVPYDAEAAMARKAAVEKKAVAEKLKMAKREKAAKESADKRLAKPVGPDRIEVGADGSIEVFHSSDAGRPAKDLDEVSRGNAAVAGTRGIWFAPSEKYSKEWGPVTRKYKVSPKNPLDLRGIALDEEMDRARVADVLAERGLVVDEKDLGGTGREVLSWDEWLPNVEKLGDEMRNKGFDAYYIETSSDLDDVARTQIVALEKSIVRDAGEVVADKAGSDFKAAFDRADKGGTGRYVFIHDLRAESGLSREAFDKLLAEKMIDGTVAAHPGNPGDLTDQQVEDGFVDEFKDRYVTVSWRGAREPSFSMAGRKGARHVGKTPAMKKAYEMKAEGRSRDEIWSETGWWEITPGQWRFEIDDSKIELRGGELAERFMDMFRSSGERPYWDKPVPLSEIVDAPDLFKAYPHLKKVKVLPDLYGFGASYDGAAKKISLGMDIPVDAVKSSLLHEIQHSIQEHEGHAHGGSPALFEGRLFDKHPSLKEAFGKTMSRRPGGSEGEAGYDAYRLLVGEVESRLTQKRMDMTEAERGAEPPWKTLESMLRSEKLLDGNETPEELMTEWYGGGEQASVDKAMGENEAGPQSRIATDKIQSIVRSVSRGWKNAAPVIVVERQSELPPGILDYADEDTIIDGVYWGGAVYMVAENLSSDAHVVETFLHESFGHHGIRGFFRSKGERLREYDEFLGEVYEAKKGDIAELADLGYRFDLSTERGRAFAAEEILSRMAASDVQDSFLDRLIEMVMKALRTVAPNIRLSEAEIRRVLANAGKWVREGEAGTAFGEGATADPAYMAEERKAYDEALYAREYVSPLTKRGKLSEREKQTRALAYGIKGASAEEIREAAEEMAALIPGDKSKAILVPIPGHTGETAVNVRIAQEIAAISGGRVADVLKRMPSDSQRERRINKKRGQKPDEIETVAVRKLEDVENVYFVDNMITSGATIRSAKNAVGGGRGLVFAKSFSGGPKYMYAGKGGGDPAYQSEKKAPVWHSQMQAVAERKLPGKATAGQLKDMLSGWAKKGEFKAEELAWSGVEEWLDGKEGKVSRDEVLDFMRGGQVEIRELSKSEKRWSVTDRDGNREHYETREEAEKIAEEWRDFVVSHLEGDGVFEYYVKESDESGEIVYDVEDSYGNKVSYGLKSKEDAEYEAELLKEEAIKEARDGVTVNEYDSDDYRAGQDSAKYSTWQMSGDKENYRELLLTLPEKAGGERGPKGWGDTAGGTMDSLNHRSSHWDEPNVLAHVRFNERTGPGGERILFLEEVQSDWHQEGRNRGYKSDLGRLKQGHRLDEYRLDNQLLYRVVDENGKSLSGGYPEKNGALKEYMEGQLGGGGKDFSTPDAPFKTTWPMLVMKRMVRYASENGFDSIAWTPGDVQADRYDLRKQVDTIRYMKTPSGEYAIGALKDGYAVQKSVLKPEEIESHLGKDVAQKILNGEGKVYKTDENGNSAMDLEGDDLKVGGSGMAGFYDKILPSETKKFFGKAAWGNPTVGKAEIDASGFGTPKRYVGPVLGVEELRGLAAQGNASAGMSLQDIAREMEGGATFQEAADRNASDAVAALMGGKMERAEKPMEVWHMPITPAMRRKALTEGMPMFARRRKGETGAAYDGLDGLPQASRDRVRPRLESSGKGLGDKTLLTEFKNGFVRGKNMFFRSFEHLDPDRHGHWIDTLRLFREAPSIARRKAAEKLVENMRPLTDPDQKRVFELHLVMQDMLSDIESGNLPEIPPQGETLPFGFANKDEAKTYANWLSREVSRSRPLLDAVDARNRSMRELRDELVEQKLLPEGVKRDDRYFHHQVLLYRAVGADNYRLSPGLSQEDVRMRKKGWQRSRTGSLEDYSTEYITSEFEVVSQAIQQLETKKTMDYLQETADIRQALEARAKAENLAMFSAAVGLADPTKPYRVRIAMHSKNLEKLAARGKLPVGTGKWRPVIKVLANNHRDGTMDSHPMFFPYLAYLLETGQTGNMQAAGIFKALWDKEHEMRRVLGDQYRTYRDYVKLSDGYVEWNPKPEGVWFQVNAFPDHIIEKMRAGLPMPDRISKVWARGTAQSWVIPVELARTMDDMGGGAPKSGPDQWVVSATNRWKEWTLINPFNVVRYTTNNLSGDMDIIFAADPGVFKHAQRAIKLLWKDWRKKPMTTAERAAVDELLAHAIIGSGFVLGDLEGVVGDLSYDKTIELLTGKDPGVIKKVWREIAGFNNFRENILRAAAFWRFKERIANGEIPGKNMNVVSNQDEIAKVFAEAGADRAAAKLARELIGDYGNISVAGRWLRQRVWPFWSWMEINAPRYVRLLRNVRHESGGSTGRVAAVLSVRMAWGTTKLGLKAFALAGMVQLFNVVVFPDEERELSDAQRRQLHLILGRREDGSVMTLRFQGALSDTLGWFGGEDILSDVGDLISGKKTAGEQLLESAKAAPSRLIVAANPFGKAAYEMLAGESLYPDPFNSRPIRDRAEHVAKLFSLDMPYDWAVGKPKRGGDVSGKLWNDLLSLGFYFSDPGEAAYWDAKSLSLKFLKRKGEQSPSVEPTDRQNAVYYYKVALRYGDLSAADRYLDKYKELKGDMKSIKVSIKMSSPLSSFAGSNRKYRREFLDGLGERDRGAVERAEKWYREVYLRRGAR
jgi:hypothetical protein